MRPELLNYYKDWKPGPEQLNLLQGLALPCLNKEVLSLRPLVEQLPKEVLQLLEEATRLERLYLLRDKGLQLNWANERKLMEEAEEDRRDRYLERGE